jgi:hypothetical protein
MQDICEKLTEITACGRHPEFADPAFRAALDPLIAILGHENPLERLRSGVELAPLLRSAMAGFGASLALSELAKEELYATMLDLARRTHDRTMERLRTGRTWETLRRQPPAPLAGEDDAALGSMGP